VIYFPLQGEESHCVLLIRQHCADLLRDLLSYYQIMKRCGSLCCRASRLSAIAPMSVGNRGLSNCWIVHSNSSYIVLAELVWDCILIESQNLCPTESVRPHGCSEAAKMQIIKLDRLWYKMPTPKGVAGRICSHWLAKNAVQPLFPPIHTYIHSTNPTSKH